MRHDTLLNSKNCKMRKLFYLIVLLLTFSCSDTPKINYPYTFVDTKSETSGATENFMELYAIENEINIDTLKMFCLEKKNDFTNGTFHYIVFFDSKENVTFPSNPFTAFYGTDENAMKHIKAYYEYNRMNGYSELRVFEKNSFESPATTIKL
jgi:hypothetical protein